MTTHFDSTIDNAAVTAAASVPLPTSPNPVDPFQSPLATQQQPLTAFPPPPPRSPDSDAYATPTSASPVAVPAPVLPQSSRLPGVTGIASQVEDSAPAVTATEQPAPFLPTRPREREMVADPRITALQSMFPDIDGETLALVLDSVGGDQDRAIDALLGMSDPDYVSPEPQEQAMSQSDLDERFARQLMLEEEQQASRYEQQQQQPPRGRVNFSGGPDAPGRQDRQQGQQSNEAGIGGPNMAEIQEQLTKFAETGKKTFTNILGKVKAKYNEFDQQRQEYPMDNTPQWGQSSSEQPYYDPNAPRRNSESQPRTEYRPTQAPVAVAAPVPTGPTPASQIINEYRNRSPLDEGSATPRPPSAGQGISGAPIDGAKLGLLPKRPVSLVRPSSPGTVGAPGTAPVIRRQDSDELEYAENPFEDSARR